ncbi:hypothetical protein XI03_25095 [Bradyrhizobium sp. CCBAU 65884]|nr:hypothetical protein [Bradyrhizobium sp. CCBAU 65884]
MSFALLENDDSVTQSGNITADRKLDAPHAALGGLLLMDLRRVVHSNRLADSAAAAAQKIAQLALCGRHEVEVSGIMQEAAVRASFVVRYLVSNKSERERLPA